MIFHGQKRTLSSNFTLDIVIESNEGGVMKFSLIYEGELKSNGNPQHKQNIRECFRAQLKVLWQSDSLSGLFDYATGSKEASLTSMGNVRIDFPANPEFRDGEGWCVNRRGSIFLPIVCKSLRTTAEIDIVWYRSERPGDFLPQGDIDNRLKTLFDAFQVPDENQLQIATVESSASDPYLTVLEDDALISRINVETKQLLKPHSDNDVLLLIDVNTKVSAVTFENINLI